MQRGIACAVLIGAVASAGSAWASSAHVYLLPTDYTGSRSTAAGLLADGNQAGGGFVFRWEIDFGQTFPDMWTYKYTIKRASGLPVALSHLNFETSLDYPTARTLVKNHPGSPTQPADIFGLKFNFESDTYTLVNSRAPVWGDVYGKKGNGGFYNVGIGTDPTAQTTDFTHWVATPNSVKIPPPSATTIPSPAAAGAGLILLGLTAFRRRRA